MSWLFGFRRKQPQQAEQAQLPFGAVTQLGAIVQIEWEAFLNHFIRQSIQRLGLETPLRSELLTAVREQVARVLSVAVTPADITVPIWSPDAFTVDMKRKVAIILTLFKNIVHEDAGEYNMAVKMYTEAVSKSDEKLISEATQRVIKSFIRLLATPPALLVALNALLGMIQANLPLHRMPNVPKMTAGYASQ
ncbi:MAG: hypothetical protein JHC33_11835 [Ignisphaera sp.]|nr:hypothetical protein [Ignisphaera sp.]